MEKVVTKLLKSGVRPEQIGVITPYEGQRAHVVQSMQHNGAMPPRLYQVGVVYLACKMFSSTSRRYVVVLVGDMWWY